MTVRRAVWFLALAIVIVVGSFSATLAFTDHRPVLGLDLQGGISVVLAPVGTPKPEAIDKAVDIIRSRVDSLGVAEPEISRQGDLIIVDLPGVRDRTKAQRLVGKTAELRFRPVLQTLPPEGATPPSTSSTTSAGASGASGATGASGASGATTTTTIPEIPTTPPEQDKADAIVVLPGRTPPTPPIRYQLGPTLLTGKAVSTASSAFEGGGWGVNVKFTGQGGQDFVNKVANPNVNKQVAIVLDGVVQSAPVINPGITAGNPVRISGSFTQQEAQDLAVVLRFGALPVQLKQETVDSVSPTLGKDQLRAGLIAGVIGLALVALYMLIFYRVLGLVVWFGLALTGMAVFTLVSWLGFAIGLTLTLAGVTGLIVSVGVTVDSYVVYFERLKDEVRAGKTVRSSVDRGFARSFRTIVAADLVSLIGALVLYLLAIGSVRGFAFFLGLSTLLDLILSYFVMHPLVSLMARRRALVTTRGVGIAAGLDCPEVAA
ncbi:MAG: protein translocase subunit SecD [Actinomycetes bacterium]